MKESGEENVFGKMVLSVGWRLTEGKLSIMRPLQSSPRYVSVSTSVVV